MGEFFGICGRVGQKIFESDWLQFLFAGKREEGPFFFFCLTFSFFFLFFFLGCHPMLLLIGENLKEVLVYARNYYFNLMEFSCMMEILIIWFVKFLSKPVYFCIPMNHLFVKPTERRTPNTKQQQKKKSKLIICLGPTSVVRAYYITMAHIKWMA